MGSIDTPTRAENGSSSPLLNGTVNGQTAGNGAVQSLAVESNGASTESDSLKRRKASMLPLEVGTRVMCRWRDGKYHPVKVIERRKVSSVGNNEYEYYVHYTECKQFVRASFLILTIFPLSIWYF